MSQAAGLSVAATSSTRKSLAKRSLRERASVHHPGHLHQAEEVRVEAYEILFPLYEVPQLVQQERHSGRRAIRPTCL